MESPQVTFKVDNDTMLEVFNNQLVIVHKGVNVKTIPFTPRLAMHLQYLSGKISQELVNELVNRNSHHE